MIQLNIVIDLYSTVHHWPIPNFLFYLVNDSAKTDEDLGRISISPAPNNLSAYLNKNASNH
jgi:hypothetical protein